MYDLSVPIKHKFNCCFFLFCLCVIFLNKVLEKMCVLSLILIAYIIHFILFTYCEKFEMRTFLKCFERLKQQFITFIRDLRVFTFLVERIFCSRCSVGTLFLLRLFGPIPSTKWSEHTLEYLQHQNTQNGIIKYWKGRKKRYIYLNETCLAMKNSLKQ